MSNYFSSIEVILSRIECAIAATLPKMFIFLLDFGNKSQWNKIWLSRFQCNYNTSAMCVFFADLFVRFDEAFLSLFFSLSLISVIAHTHTHTHLSFGCEKKDVKKCKNIH